MSGRKILEKVSDIFGLAGHAPRLPAEYDLSIRSSAATDLLLRLQDNIIGQDHVLPLIADAYEIFTSGMRAENKPAGSFLFLGPTGVGKTETVEAFAEAMVGTRRAVLRIDCAEFQHDHEIAKLIGSPPGYLGHRETHPILSQQHLDLYHTRDCQMSFVLFDEVEKAHPTVHQLLLAILDKARLKLGDNTTTNFNRTMIFMTSNAGAKNIANVDKSFGFAAPPDPGEDQEAAIQKSKARVNKTALAEARRVFAPEFLNRFDHICGYKALGAEELSKIFDLLIFGIRQMFHQSLEDRDYKMDRDYGPLVTAEAKALLLEKAPPDIKYGARELKRVVNREIARPLGTLIASEQIREGHSVLIDCHEGRLKFRPIMAPALGELTIEEQHEWPNLAEQKEEGSGARKEGQVAEQRKPDKVLVAGRRRSPSL